MVNPSSDDIKADNDADYIPLSTERRRAPQAALTPSSTEGSNLQGLG